MVKIRARDLPPAPEPPPETIPEDTRIDDVLRRLDEVQKAISEKTPVDDRVAKLADEVAALRAQRAQPWEFTVQRDGAQKITKVIATQTRSGLI